MSSWHPATSRAPGGVRRPKSSFVTTALHGRPPKTDVESEKRQDIVISWWKENQQSFSQSFGIITLFCVYGITLYLSTIKTFHIQLSVSTTLFTISLLNFANYFTAREERKVHNLTALQFLKKLPRNVKKNGDGTYSIKLWRPSKYSEVVSLNYCPLIPLLGFIWYRSWETLAVKLRAHRFDDWIISSRDAQSASLSGDQSSGSQSRNAAMQPNGNGGDILAKVATQTPPATSPPRGGYVSGRAIFQVPQDYAALPPESSRISPAPNTHQQPMYYNKEAEQHHHMQPHHQSPHTPSGEDHLNLAAQNGEEAFIAQPHRWPFSHQTPGQHQPPPQNWGPLGAQKPPSTPLQPYNIGQNNNIHNNNNNNIGITPRRAFGLQFEPPSQPQAPPPLTPIGMPTPTSPTSGQIHAKTPYQPISGASSGFLHDAMVQPQSQPAAHSMDPLSPPTADNTIEQPHHQQPQHSYGVPQTPIRGFHLGQPGTPASARPPPPPNWSIQDY